MFDNPNMSKMKRSALIYKRQISEIQKILMYYIKKTVDPSSNRSDFLVFLL